MKTLTPEQTARLAELRAMNARHVDAWKRFASHGRNGSSATVAQQAQINAVQPFSNEQRAELETLLFLSTPAQREFLYPAERVTKAPAYEFAPGFDSLKLTGWTGNALMSVTCLGRVFRSNMGDTRRSVSAMGINGTRYVGTIYGTYCRMRPAK